MDATDSVVIDPPVDPEPLRRIRPTFHLKSLTIVIAMIAVVFSFSLPELAIGLILIVEMTLVTASVYAIPLAVMYVVMGLIREPTPCPPWRLHQGWLRYAPLIITLNFCAYLGLLLVLLFVEDPTPGRNLFECLYPFQIPFVLVGPLYFAYLYRTEDVVPRSVILWAWMGMCLVIEVVNFHPHMREEMLALAAVMARFSLLIILAMALFHHRTIRPALRVDEIIGWVIVEIHVILWGASAWSFLR